VSGTLNGFYQSDGPVCANVHEKRAASDHVSRSGDVWVFGFCGVSRDYDRLRCRSAFIMLGGVSIRRKSNDAQRYDQRVAN